MGGGVGGGVAIFLFKVLKVLSSRKEKKVFRALCKIDADSFVPGDPVCTCTCTCVCVCACASV